jgi:hypothetical protein
MVSWCWRFTGLPDDLNCDSDLDELLFFQACLYYHKGITKYSASWDIDQLWMPPRKLHIDGRRGYAHCKHHDYVEEQSTESLVRNPNSSDTMNSSDWSTFPAFVRDDGLWQESPYAKSVSIADTMKAIEHQCANSWCFHFPPSRMKSYTKRIGKDFLWRESDYSIAWQKSVVSTNGRISLGRRVVLV